MPGEINIYTCGCTPMPGTQPPDLAPYVVSVNSLQGLLNIAADGGVSIRSENNTIFIGVDGTAGLGTVTSVNASSSNSNLTVVGGPITTTGTFTFNLAGALASISGLVTAADKMIYTTALDTYAVTSLTGFARNLLSDANSGAAQITLALVPGTNVQAWSPDLDAFVTNASWSGANLTLAGNVSAVNGTFSGNGAFTGTLGAAGLATLNGGINTGSITAATIAADGSGLTNLNASNVSSGTLAVARGGTNISSYAVGDIIYASGATALSKLADVSVGSYLRSGGVTTAPLWSTLKLPNAATTGDILYGSSANNIGNLADVATGNVLLSGGVGSAPGYGKVTSTHTDGSTIATLTAGDNSNIASFSGDISAAGSWTFNSLVILNSELNDSTFSPGGAGYILTSTGSQVLWSNQISLDTLNIVTSLSTEATVTAGGTTGAQVINKLSGSVNFAAGASSLIVTNSLCTADTFIFCTVLSNDTTALIKNVVATSGSFTIRLNAVATAETKVAFLLVEPS